MNFQTIGFAGDASDLVAFASTPSGRIGPVAVTLENIQPENAPSAGNTAYVVIKQLTNSGWANLVSGFTVAPGGRVIKTVNAFSKRIGFFGSGNAKVNVQIHHTYPAGLRGNHLDLEVVGRRGYGFDTGVDSSVSFPGLNLGTPSGSL